VEGLGGRRASTRIDDGVRMVETTFQRFGQGGRAPEGGVGYSCSIPVGGGDLVWRARLGAGGARYRVDKRVVTSRTSFFETSSRVEGSQEWRFGGDARAPLFYLVAPVRGRVQVRHAGAETELGPGQYAVANSAGPLDVRYGDTGRVVMAFAGEKALSRDGRLTAAIGTALPVDDVGGLLFRHLAATLRVADSLGATSLTAAADAAGDLMAAALSGLPVADVADRAALRSRIETFVELHLRDPDLDVRRIAAAHHVSPRTVYRLFDAAGEGVAAHVRGRRLDRCREDVVGRPDLSVAAICERWSAGEPKHFARKYRARFGESPGETRRRGGAEW